MFQQPVPKQGLAVVGFVVSVVEVAGPVYFEQDHFLRRL